jgi:peptidoglycan/xylan/chitin deacetylase (PgdA/CDA1 family)
VKELIINFHGVGSPPAGLGPSELNYWLNERAFGLLLDRVTASAHDLRVPLFITFDDGNASDALIALPALMQRNLKARFFVCAGRIGCPNYLDRSAILDLLKSGMTVGSHGMNHVDWRRASTLQLQTEIVEARRRLEEICGQAVHEVAIPFGSYGRREIARLKEQKFSCVFTSSGGYAHTGSWLKPRNSVDPLWLSRNFIAELRRLDGRWTRARNVLGEYYRFLR